MASMSSDKRTIKESQVKSKVKKLLLGKKRFLQDEDDAMLDEDMPPIPQMRMPKKMAGIVQTVTDRVAGDFMGDIPDHVKDSITRQSKTIARNINKPTNIPLNPITYFEGLQEQAVDYGLLSAIGSRQRGGLLSTNPQRRNALQLTFLILLLSDQITPTKYDSLILKYTGPGKDAAATKAMANPEGGDPPERLEVRPLIAQAQSIVGATSDGDLGHGSLDSMQQWVENTWNVNNPSSAEYSIGGADQPMRAEDVVDSILKARGMDTSYPGFQTKLYSSRNLTGLVNQNIQALERLIDRGQRAEAAAAATAAATAASANAFQSDRETISQGRDAALKAKRAAAAAAKAKRDAQALDAAAARRAQAMAEIAAAEAKAAAEEAAGTAQEREAQAAALQAEADAVATKQIADTKAAEERNVGSSVTDNERVTEKEAQEQIDSLQDEVEEFTDAVEQGLTNQLSTLTVTGIIGTVGGLLSFIGQKISQSLEPGKPLRTELIRLRNELDEILPGKGVVLPVSVMVALAVGGQFAFRKFLRDRRNRKLARRLARERQFMYQMQTALPRSTFSGMSDRDLQMLMRELEKQESRYGGARRRF